MFFFPFFLENYEKIKIYIFLKKNNNFHKINEMVFFNIKKKFFRIILKNQNIFENFYLLLK